MRAHLLSQDLIYVGGGSLLSLLGVWRAHGIDEILREAWEAGVVLCGLSAGSLCWFAEAVSGYHGEVNRVEGLGLLSHSATRSTTPTATGGRPSTSTCSTACRSGYAAEDGAALRFVGDELVEVVASRPEARAYRLERRGALRGARRGSRPASSAPVSARRWCRWRRPSRGLSRMGARTPHPRHAAGTSSTAAAATTRSAT